MTDTSLFTPSKGSLTDEQLKDFALMGDGSDRIILLVSEEDRNEFDALPKGEAGALFGVAVTDTATGHTLMVRRGPCGAGCFCGAEVTGILPSDN